MAKLSALVILAIGFIVAVAFFSKYWLPIGLVGVSLIVISRIGAPSSNRANGDLVMHPSDPEIFLPEKWNEQQIAQGFVRYQERPNLLTKYVGGIVSRFVMGQDMHTMEVRTKYLETYNSYAAIAREAYQWHRYMHGKRAMHEEDLKDLRAEGALKDEREDQELKSLERDAKRQEIKLKMEKLKRESEEANRPAPAPPPQPTVPSTSEARAQKRRDLEEREAAVLEQIRITRINPTLDPDQRQQKLNALEDALNRIVAEIAELF
jgi:hypothetical protein